MKSPQKFDESSEHFQFNKINIDIIFCSVNKHKPNMTFDVFLQALIKISELKYANTTSPSLALQSLIVNYLLPLHSMIYTKAHNKYGIEGGILNL